MSVNLYYKTLMQWFHTIHTCACARLMMNCFFPKRTGSCSSMLLSEFVCQQFCFGMVASLNRRAAKTTGRPSGAIPFRTWLNTIHTTIIPWCVKEREKGNHQKLPGHTRTQSAKKVEIFELKDPTNSIEQIKEVRPSHLSVHECVTWTTYMTWYRSSIFGNCGCMVQAKQRHRSLIIRSNTNHTLDGMASSIIHVDDVHQDTKCFASRGVFKTNGWDVSEEALPPRCNFTSTQAAAPTLAAFFIASAAESLPSVPLVAVVAASSAATGSMAPFPLPRRATFLALNCSPGLSSTKHMLKDWIMLVK